jgi:hypothetical protein
MDISLARTVLRGAFRSADELQQLLPQLKEGCDPDEYASYAKAIATAVAEIALEVTNRIIADHPQLQAEVEESIARTGNYP